MLQRSKRFLVLALTIGMLGVLAPVASAATVTDDSAVVTSTTADDTVASRVEPARRDGGGDNGDNGDSSDDDADACGRAGAFLVLEVPNLLCLEIPPS